MCKNKEENFIRLFRKSAKGEIDTFGEEKQFSTFHGVYRPTILTILGLMMYLREGWLVGNAGLLGAILVISLAFLITGITALSISTIISNIRIGRGGVFSLVSQSLGLEVGGSIGIPLFLAQSFSAPMYMFGFVEGWRYLFPEHPPQMVLFIVFFVAASLSSFSAKLSFYVQFFVMGGVFFALCSIYGGLFVHEGLHMPQWWGQFSDGNFWKLFSIFFPAATGILVGSSMSGNLKNPRKNISYGTIYAWATALFVYLTLAIWYSLVESPQTLQSNSFISISRSLFPKAVLVGILSSCFSATVSSMVAAPRVLQALGEYGLLPYSSFFKKLKKGEPRFASLFTSLMILLPLLFFDGIDGIAPFVTQFFISIYFIINSILAIEQGLNLLSFRPTMRWPKFLPILGSFLCLVAMMVISPIIGCFSIVFIVSIYIYLSKKKLKAPWETVQSGLFVSLAEWSVRKVVLSENKDNRRTWKPDLIVLVATMAQWEEIHFFLHSIVYPQGSLKLIMISKKEENKILLEQLKHKANLANKQGMLTSVAVMNFPNYVDAIKTIVPVMQGFFLSPNSLMFPLRTFSQDEVVSIVELARQTKKALIFNVHSPKKKKFSCNEITLWVRDQSPNWKLSLNLSNLDYSLLLAYQFKKNNGAYLRLCCAVRREKDVLMVDNFLKELVYSGRFGSDIEIHVLVQDFHSAIKKYKNSDLHIFGLSTRPIKSDLLKIYKIVGNSCLFVCDSGTGRESALA